MYLDYFHLNKDPFSLTPDTSFFLEYGPYKEALQTLIVAIRNGEGFIKVTGEVGTGKTLLCRKLLNHLNEEMVTAYIPNPNISSKTLTVALAKELNIKFPQSANEYTLQQLITARLMHYYGDNRKVILCIDEAQAMPDKTLEALRLLTNLETERSKLLQVVLFGQPELDEKLQSKHLRQLRQRVSFSYDLKRLDMDMMISYLTHRLKVAGYAGGDLFQMTALKLLHKYSRGIPRLVNLICHKAFILCYGKGEQQISKKIMREAIADTEDAYTNELYSPVFIWLVSFFILISISGIALSIYQVI